jgi:aryl-alcohol dehydrogenase-like predicted oxidoreductase
MAYDFAVANGLHRPIVEQPQYNLIHREKVETEFAPLYKKMKLGLTIWSPLASGILTGKYLNGIPENSRAAMPSLSFVKDEVLNPVIQSQVIKLNEISKKSGISMTHISLAWCVLNPNVSTVILGASRLEQLKDNMQALVYLNQVAELRKELDSI